MGDFVVRISTVNSVARLAISALAVDGVHHVTIHDTHGQTSMYSAVNDPKYSLPAQFSIVAGRTFSSAEDLVDFYVATGDTLVPNEAVRITNGIARQPWQLRRDQLRLERPIGYGAFGEVVKGALLFGEWCSSCDHHFLHLQTTTASSTAPSRRCTPACYRVRPSENNPCARRVSCAPTSTQIWVGCR